MGQAGRDGGQHSGRPKMEFCLVVPSPELIVQVGHSVFCVSGHLHVEIRHRPWMAQPHPVVSDVPALSMGVWPFAGLAVTGLCTRSTIKRGVNWQDGRHEWCAPLCSTSNGAGSSCDLPPLMHHCCLRSRHHQLVDLLDANTGMPSICFAEICCRLPT